MGVAFIVYDLAQLVSSPSPRADFSRK